MTKIKSKLNIFIFFCICLFMLGCFNIIKSASQKVNDEKSFVTTDSYTWIVNDEKELLKILDLSKNGDSIFLTNSVFINGNLSINKNVNFILNENLISISGDFQTKNFDTSNIQLTYTNDITVLTQNVL